MRLTCRIYPIYVIPKDPSSVLTEILSEVRKDLEKRNRQKKKVVITGDFNAKHPYWGGNKTDEKRTIMLDWTYALNLNILNDGKKPTLIRHNGISYVDLTLVCNKTMAEHPEWLELGEEFCPSDHQFIILKISNTKPKNNRWKFSKADLTILNKVFQKETRNRRATVTGCNESMTTAYEKSTVRMKCKEGKKCLTGGQTTYKKK